MKPQPFTWESYWREFKNDPDFELLDKFSFDHLSGAEVESIVEKLIGAATALGTPLSEATQ